MLAELFKILGSTLDLNSYRCTQNGLAFNFLNQSAILSKRDSNKLSVCMKTFNSQISFS